MTFCYNQNHIEPGTILQLRKYSFEKVKLNQYQMYILNKYTLDAATYTQQMFQINRSCQNRYATEEKHFFLIKILLLLLFMIAELFMIMW